MRVRWPWSRNAEPAALAEPGKRAGKPREIGATGTVYFAGVIADEYNRDLAGARGIETYDKMRRSDAQVQAVLWICELPIRSATWSVEPASDDPTDVEIAQIVQDNLLENMTITWDDFLRQVLLMLPFGHMVFEKVWQRRDGLVMLRKLAPRLPASIAKWDMAADGGLLGIEQLVWTGSAYERPYIPVDKLLVFTNRKEGANWAGQSLLRAAYKHWYYKDNFYRIDAIAGERHGVGIPYVKMAPEAGDADYEEAAEILQALHAHERTYVVGKSTWEEFAMVGVAGPAGGIKSCLESINHHDVMIARSILAQFLNLGATEAGSYALSRDQSSFFLMALRSLANQISDVINEYVIKPMVDMNWTVSDYPKLVCTKLEQRDLAGYGDTVAKLIASGAIVVDEPLRDALRDMFGLPEEPEDTTPPETPEPERQDDAPDDTPEGDDQDEPPPPLHDCGHGHTHRLSDAGYWRELRASEDEGTLADMRDAVERGKEDYIAAAQAVAARQMDRLIELALPAIEAKDAGKLTNLSAPYKAELAQAMVGVLQQVYLRGRATVDVERWHKTELPRLTMPDSFALVDPELLAGEFLAAKAKSAAQMLSTRLLAALTWEALDQVKEGAADEPALRSVMEELSERNLTDMANTSVPEALNLGRRDAVAEIADQIDRAEYSAILDNKVCPTCRALDGLVVTLDDPRYERYMPPNPECDGGDRCRCVWMLIFKAETKAVR